MPDPNLTERPPHDEAEELLPWYATGQLDEADRERVEAHLASCAYCRQQLAIERRLMNEFQAMTPEVESGWARLKSRIETPPHLAVAPPTEPRRIRSRPWARARVADVGRIVSRRAVAGIAAAQLAFLVVAGATLFSLSEPKYHALGSAPVPSSANIIVMFRADATVEDVRHALEGAGATIVEGPTSADAYLLHVAPQQRQAAMAKLKTNDFVQMAEPIDGVRS